MQKLINKILVPVDLSINCMKAVKAASEMASKYSSSIDLLFIDDNHTDTSMYSPEEKGSHSSKAGKNRSKVSAIMDSLAHSIPETKAGRVKVSTHVTSGPVTESVIRFIAKNRIDIVLTEQKKGFIWNYNSVLDTERVASLTNIPVITLPANKTLTILSSVLIPVTDYLPIRKLMYAIYLSHPALTVIKLLGIRNNSNFKLVEHYQERSFQLIQQHSPLNTELDIIASPAPELALLSYANTHASDLIIVNPGIQRIKTGLLSLLSRKWSNTQFQSPVLTVNTVKAY